MAEQPPPVLPFGHRLADHGELLPTEKKLVEGCRTGRGAVLGNGERPTELTSETHIRAGVLRTICLATDPTAPIHEQGVQLVGAWIDGPLDLEAATLPRRLGLKNCWIDGEIRLQHATTVTLSMLGSRSAGVVANSLRCRGDLNLRAGFRSDGKVDLGRATIEGDLNCAGGRFDNGDGDAMAADRAEIGGSVFLNNGFHATGEVRLLGATIGGGLACRGGRFDNDGGDALSADRAEIGGGVFLDTGFHAAGEVRLLGAKIGGGLACRGGRFDNAEGDALSADGAEIGGDVFLDPGFHATGAVRLLGAKIGGDLTCRLGRFDNPGRIGLALDNAKVAGTAFFDGSFEATGELRLTGASIATVFDDAKTGPILVLDGFTWTRFGPGAACDARSRIAWLDRQPPDDLGADFKPQPWEQCAAVLAAMGHEEDARRIRMEKRRRMRRARLLRAVTPRDRARAWVGGIFDRLLDLSIGYGWRPLRPVYALFGLWLVASLAYASLPPGVMAPTDSRVFLDPSIPAECRVDWIGYSGPTPPRVDDEKRRETLSRELGAPQTLAWKDICGRRLPSEYSAFQPALYALDVLLPVVDLRQERDWAPRITDVDGNTLYPIGAPLHIDHPVVSVITGAVGAAWSKCFDGLEWVLGLRFRPFEFGVGHLTRLFEWGLIGFGWIASLLLVAGVTGVVRRD